MPANTNSNARKARVNLKDLKKLIDMMRKADLSEVNIEQEGIKIALKKGAEPQAMVFHAAPPVAAPVVMEAAPAAVPQAAPVAAAAPAPVAPVEAEEPAIESPMVGTFYRASSPESEPYAKEGMRVEIGQTVCIIEAMKLMNEIKAEIAGTITKVLVENAQPVEFGQPLFTVKP
ncbi:MAG: acetyl-CoA carboxylase biotin carboxyl carrier protein [candidate division FCPU426 bacterium]